MKQHTLHKTIARCLVHMLVPVLAAVLSSHALAGAAGGDLFAEGLAQYEANKLESAIALLEQAVAVEPDRSEYYHYLAKSYGKLAQKSTWFKAMKFSQRTLMALENAVRTDPHNLPALQDLIKYYRQAPGFLGGDLTKADMLEKKMKSLERGKDLSAKVN